MNQVTQWTLFSKIVIEKNSPQPKSPKYLYFYGHSNNSFKKNGVVLGVSFRMWSSLAQALSWARKNVKDYI